MTDLAERQRGLRLVVAIVAVLVVVAMALGAVLLNRGGTDATRADAVEPSSSPTAADEADEEQADATATGEPAAGASTAAADSDTPTPCPSAPPDVPEPTTSPYEEPPSADLGDAETVRATITTTCGAITLSLDAAAAPATVANFVALAEDGYYDGVGFHRVIDGFMIQGGDPTGTGTGCLDASCSTRLPGYAFADELTLAESVVEESGGYPRGTLAMANAGPDTNGSQFFIVQATPGYPLPPNYAVFGTVTDGMRVVDRIALGPVDGDLAVEPVVIRSIDIAR